MFAVIHNDTITSVAVGEPPAGLAEAFGAQAVRSIDDVLINGQQPAIGWTWMGGDEYIPPNVPEPEPQPRHITVGAFLLRFGQNMVPILTSSDPIVQALCILVRAMTYIDLDDVRLTQQLPYLVQAKLLTLDELQEVLAAEIQPKERP